MGKWNKWIIFCLLISFSFSQIDSKQKKRHKRKHKGKTERVVQKPTNRTLFENYFYEGIIKYAQGDYDEALNYLLNAFQEDPTQSAPAYYIASIYQKKKNFVEALRYAKKCYELDPDNLHYALLYAELLTYTKGSKIDEAIRILETMCKRYPHELTLKFHLIELYIANRNYKLAIKEIGKIEKLIGNNPEITREKIKLFLLSGLKEEAVTELRRLVELYPHEEDYWRQLFQLYKELGKEDSAEALLESYYQLNPNSTTAIFSLVELYIQQGKWDKVKIILDRAVENNTLPPQVKVDYLTSLYLSYPNRLPYLDYGKILTQVHPRSASVYLFLGDLYSNEFMLDSAYHYYKKALVLDKGNVRLWEYLISMEMETNRWDSAEAHAAEAIELFPYQTNFYYYGAIAAFQLKNYQKCVEQLQEIVSLGSSDDAFLSDVYALMGDAYYYLGQHAKSDSAYEKAISYNPNNTVALNNYAYFLSLRKERLDYAEKMAEKVLQLQPNVPTYLDTYGWIQFQKGNLKKALHYIERAYKMQKDPEIIEHLGDIYHTLGDKQKALQLWKEAINLAPHNENLRQKIDQYEN